MFAGDFDRRFRNPTGCMTFRLISNARDSPSVQSATTHARRSTNTISAMTRIAPSRPPPIYIWVSLDVRAAIESGQVSPVWTPPHTLRQEPTICGAFTFDRRSLLRAPHSDPSWDAAVAGQSEAPAETGTAAFSGRAITWSTVETQPAIDSVPVHLMTSSTDAKSSAASPSAFPYGPGRTVCLSLSCR